MGSRGLWAARENPVSLCLISVSSVLAVCHCQMSLFQCHELLSEGPEVHELSYRRTSVHQSRQPHSLQPRAQPRGPRRPPSAPAAALKKINRPKPEDRFETAARLSRRGTSFQTFTHAARGCWSRPHLSTGPDRTAITMRRAARRTRQPPSMRGDARGCAGLGMATLRSKQP